MVNQYMYVSSYIVQCPGVGMAENASHLTLWQTYSTERPLFMESNQQLMHNLTAERLINYKGYPPLTIEYILVT